MYISANIGLPIVNQYYFLVDKQIGTQYNKDHYLILKEGENTKCRTLLQKIPLKVPPNAW